MTCTAASHQGAIKEHVASLFRTCEAHPAQARIAVFLLRLRYVLRMFRIKISGE